MNCANQVNQAVRLRVNTISGNSGVYFGNINVISGISSHSKSNTGLGDVGSRNLLYQNYNVVYDPDVIDTPIDDRDVHIFAPHYDHSASNVINSRVDSINTETFTQNAGLFIGDTDITGFDSHEKHSAGMGQTLGNRNMDVGNVNIIYDSDVFDMPLDDRDNKSGVFIEPTSPVRVNS